MAITGDLFKVVHLRTYTPQLILTYIDLVVATESGQYASNWNADLYFLVPSLKLFYHCLQKIIFKFMKITGAVRVIKGQEVLPDGSTLDEHAITDGSTVNIVIEPEKEISIKIKWGPLLSTQNVSSSVRVRELKQQLIDGDRVGFKNFSLSFSADDNDGVAADVPLEDESLPLHLCGVNDNTTIRVIGDNVQIQLVTSRGQRYFKTFPRNITVNQMKQRIRLVSRFFSDKDLLDDVWLFVERAYSHERLDEEAIIGAVLSDNDVIYLVEDRFFDEDGMFPVYYGDEEIGRVGWIITSQYFGRYSTYYSDTALSLKLRIQELLGFPVSSVDVKVRGKLMKNVEKLHHDYLNKKTEIRIEIA